MSQDQGQNAHAHASPKVVFERMIQAANRHDLDGLVAYFAPDFRSQQPLHPDRAFTGTAGVRKNWSFFFTTIPNIEIEIVNEVADGDTVWAELHYHGKQIDSKQFTLRGVSILGIQSGQIIWARVYTEPVQEPRDEPAHSLSSLS